LNRPFPKAISNRRPPKQAGQVSIQLSRNTGNPDKFDKAEACSVYPRQRLSESAWASAQYTLAPNRDGHSFTVTDGLATYSLNSVAALQFSDLTDIVASQTPAAERTALAFVDLTTSAVRLIQSGPAETAIRTFLFLIGRGLRNTLRMK